MAEHGPRILVFTGDGAGKTSAAMGKVLRLVARGYTVAVVQFMKHDADSGEIASLARLGVVVEQCGLGFVPAPSAPRYAAHQAAAAAGLERARQCVASHDAVVLDEVCGAVTAGLLSDAAVLDLLSGLEPHQVCICTGRGASAALIAVADTVSSIACVKHAFDDGCRAQEGIER